MRIRHVARVWCVVVVMTLLSVPAARASYIIVVQQVGSNVTATGSGSIDTTNLTQSVTGSGSATTNPGSAFINLGPAATTNFTEFTGLTGPTSFGTINSSFPASSGSGPLVGIVGVNHILDVPIGYTSASDLGTSTDTWTNKSLSSMGLTPGTYTYPWGTGPHADSLTVQINPAPEPASLSLIAFATLAMFHRRRRAV